MAHISKNIFSELKRYSRFAYDKGLSWGSCSNISARLSPKVFMITSSGASLRQIKKSEISICHVDTAKLIKGPKPSMEVNLHQQIYKIREDARAIFHSHPIYSSIVACAKIDLYKEIKFVLLEITEYLGPISRVEYLPAGSFSLAKAVAAKAKNSNILVLSNHGLVCIGLSLKEVIDKTEIFEFLCQLLCEAKSLRIELKPVK